MNYMDKENIMNRLQEHYTIANGRANGEIFAIFLQGSQNYIDDLFFENSDVDSRAIYLPQKKDLLLGNDISKSELILDNKEHIDRFDIRKFLQLIKTPGINNYENLFTEYYIINPKYQEFYDELIKVREKVVRANEKKFLMATMGLSKRDFMDLQKRTGGEDYDIETFGYSRKRLSNIMRFNLTVKAYLENRDFSACLKSMDQELIHKVRRTDYYKLDEALKLAEEKDKETYKLAHAYQNVDYKDKLKVLDELDDLFVDLMASAIK